MTQQASARELPVLRRGSKGFDVTALQYLLKCTQEAWRNLAADGVFGPSTEEIVRAYQGFVGVTVDGIVGQGTWGRLTDGRTPPSTVRRGSRGDCVKATQTLLAKHKYLTTAQIDGDFGPDTEAAVKRFQKDGGLPDHGTADPPTLRLLISMAV
jgi:peptidoglycan hydrolase-like protein with peptidoglycan-binding domain